MCTNHDVMFLHITIASDVTIVTSDNPHKANKNIYKLNKYVIKGQFISSISKYSLHFVG